MIQFKEIIQHFESCQGYPWWRHIKPNPINETFNCTFDDPVNGLVRRRLSVSDMVYVIADSSVTGRDLDSSLQEFVAGRVVYG